MNDKSRALALALISIERELRSLQLWSTEIPSSEALKSVQPFALDTLTLAQWLQFIFIPKIRELLENNSKLPSDCHIFPMAQVFFQRTASDTSGILAALERIDLIMNEGNIRP